MVGLGGASARRQLGAGEHFDMDVCGIDPGLDTSGYAVLSIADGDARESKRKTGVIRDAGVCRTDVSASLHRRLSQIEADFTELFEQWRPAAVGVEQLYAHYKHPRTAILMGHARGVILATAARCGVEVYSFSSTHVKRYLTGNGRASKEQMQRAIMSHFSLTKMPEPGDVADALAVALCCAHECHCPRVETVGR